VEAGRGGVDLRKVPHHRAVARGDEVIVARDDGSLKRERTETPARAARREPSNINGYG